MIKLCNRIIEYSFYGLFLLVPLAFTSKTSELFEMNKMWLTWGLTIIIVAAWLVKMVLQKKILFQRTPLDIPIGLFLASQIISTIFSLDSHVSLWGYYSRFNGGLLSIISYILLYYAFLSNLSNLGNLSCLKRLLKISLISGLIVALWGLPSHFGYDPTCLLFRGTLDVSCWTADFLPKVRIFSTLGQPDWLAAYLAILIPIAIAFFLNNSKTNPPQTTKKYQVSSSKYQVFEFIFRKKFILNTFFLILNTLFYVDLLYTRARSGFIAIWLALIFFFGIYFWFQRKKASIFNSLIIYPLSLIIILTFIIGAPISQLNKFSLSGIVRTFQSPNRPIAQSPSSPAQPLETNITDSGKIRLLVWEGALNAWKANPIFGTGVETFAFAYYKYKPIGQNLTSEWNFLYNKAHNEYLNFLTTTGIVGLGSYLLMVGSFLVLCIKYYVSSIKKGIHNTYYLLLNTALVASYVSILITNFFGFSVVITNIYLFMIPAFVFVLTGVIETEASDKQQETRRLSPATIIGIFLILISSLFSLISLIRFWQADVAFALGSNLDRAGEYQQGYSQLHKAVQLRKDESVFKDELALNNAILAASLVAQKPSDSNVQKQTIDIASALTQEAINTSNEVISQHPNNAVFWKTRVRVFYTLSQVDSRYLPRALDAIEKASLLAPNDANILYNLGVLYGQNGNIEKGIEVLEKTVALKPNYRDARYGLGLFYDQVGQNEKAITQMQYILDKISPNDESAQKSIADWSK